MSEEEKITEQRIQDTLLEEKYLDILLRHIQLVQMNCIQIGKHLIEEGNSLLGRKVIQNGLGHDRDKFNGVSWDYLGVYLKKKLNKSDKQNLGISIKHHIGTSSHHPEHWGRIDNMPEEYLIEMVCDWRARATEFGTDIRKWVNEEACGKYGFKEGDEIYKKVFKYIDLLCGKPFEAIEERKETNE